MSINEMFVMETTHQAAQCARVPGIGQHCVCCAPLQSHHLEAGPSKSRLESGYLRSLCFGHFALK